MVSWRRMRAGIPTAVLFAGTKLNVVPGGAHADVLADVFEHGLTLGHPGRKRNVQERRLMM